MNSESLFQNLEGSMLSASAHHTGTDNEGECVVRPNVNESEDNQMPLFTCISCRVSFPDADHQREHFHSDWHRYNLKRKVAELPPIIAEDFRIKVLAQRQNDEPEAKQMSCTACKKKFLNEKSFENHANSKKHLTNLSKMESGPSQIGRENPVESDDSDEPDSEIEEVDSDEWEGEPVPPEHCLFCLEEFTSVHSCLKHMTQFHSFFIPDLEYCTNVTALLTYLGEKIGCSYICIWCNTKSKLFNTVLAVRDHMRDMGHCMMKHEGESLLEYSEYYDYRTSYPDAGDNVDPDEEVKPLALGGNEFELVLPSGLVVGHRSLLRYYKQRINPDRQLILKRAAQECALGGGKVLSIYKSYGWKGACKQDVEKKVRDLKFMHRVQNKYHMQLGMKGNKLRLRLREQTLF